MSWQMGSIRTPPTPSRPAPIFLKEPSFSHKKDRTPRDSGPPRPPAKTQVPVSRLFPHKNVDQLKAQSVSFRDDSFGTLQSPHYDEKSTDLFFNQCFQVISKLGQGSFGRVFKVRSKEDDRYYAIKRSVDKFKSDSDRKRKMEEVRKHEQLPKHHNCVEFYKAWSERGYLYIQTELCKMSLQQFCEQNHSIPEPLVWDLLLDLTQAVKHLHDRNLLHMDIKPANIFISCDNTVCKLGDFGLVLELDQGDLSEAQEGDARYLAPELLDGKFSKAADIFSLGITTLEISCDLDLPPGGELWHKLRQAQIPEKFTRELSSELREVIFWMMEPQYLERPTIDHLFHCPTIQQVWQRRKRRLLSLEAEALAADVAMVTGSTATIVEGPCLETAMDTDGEPAQQQHWTTHTEFSFSDDDPSGEDISIHNNSMARPLMNSSSSSGEICDKNSICNHFSRPSYVSTPMKDCTISPMSITPFTQYCGNFSSTNSSPEASYVSSNGGGGGPYTPPGSNQNSNLLDHNNLPTKPGIEPKNLMEVFEDSTFSDSEG